jgi:hypothetical protein
LKQIVLVSFVSGHFPELETIDSLNALLKPSPHDKEAVEIFKINVSRPEEATDGMMPSENLGQCKERAQDWSRDKTIQRELV